MIILPDSKVLVQHIRDALDAVAAKHGVTSIENRDWFPEIATEISGRVSGPDIDCYARGRHRGVAAPGCRGNEWLFDFCALISDPAVKEEDRFMAQAVIVGQIEWAKSSVDQDFENS